MDVWIKRIAPVVPAYAARNGPKCGDRYRL